MLTNISLYQIFGFPLIMYGGLLTLIMILSVATLGYLIHSGKSTNIKLHIWLARITVVLALIHGVLGVLLFM